MKIKNIIPALLSGFIAASLSACVTVEKPVVLSVNGEDADLSEYNYYLNTLKLQAESTTSEEEIETYWTTETDGQTTFDALKDKAFDEMLNLRVVVEKAKSDGITVDDEVRQNATYFKKQMAASYQDEKTLYEKTGTDAKTIDKIAEMMAIRTAYLSKLTEDKTIDISEEDLKTGYDENYMAAKHILFLTKDMETQQPLSDDEITEKKALAEDVLNKIKSGADFDALMAEYTEDTGYANNPDGYTFTTGEMVPEFEEATKALNIGEVSDIVETSYGFHIIKRIEVNSDESSEETQQAYQNLYTTLVTEKLNELTAEWKKDMQITENREPIDKITFDSK